MNRIALTLLLSILISLIFLPLTGMAQDKIVYIDSYRIRLEYREFLDAQEQFNKEVEQWNVEVEDGKREIEALEAELAKQSLILSEEKRKTKEKEIQDKKIAWQRLTNEIFGPDGRAERRNTELTKPLLDKINEVLEKVALQDGYSLILDTVNGNVAYGKKELDITDKILEELETLQ